jgi:predicted dehydrogenase
MIRLAVNGAEEATRREVAPRLRGVTIVASSEACDAAAFVGTGPVDPGAFEHCLRAGKPVLLTADACPSSDALERLFGAARRANVRLAVVNPDRYLPSRQLIRQQLDAGKLGEPMLVRIHRWKPVAPETQIVPEPLVRDLELALWLLGKPPDRVYAVAHAADPSRGRYLQVHLGFPSGGMALLDYAGRLPAGDPYQSVSVIATAGAAYADDHQNMQLVYRGGRPQAMPTPEATRSLAAMLQEFVAGLHADTRGDGTAWRTVWGVADAVRQSLEARQAISLEGR